LVRVGQLVIILGRFIWWKYLVWEWKYFLESLVKILTVWKGNFDSLEREILTVWKEKFWQFGKGNFDSLEREILTVWKRKEDLTVWKGKFWQFGKGNFDSLKKKFWQFGKGNFDSLERVILTVRKAKILTLWKGPFRTTLQVPPHKKIT
jgi:superfamily I DNA and/or RNA helicase